MGWRVAVPRIRGSAAAAIIVGMSTSPLIVPSKESLEENMHRLMRAHVTEEGALTVRGPAPVWEWEMVVAGAAGAAARYDESLHADTGLAARLAVGECLWWIGSAMDFLLDTISKGVSKAQFYTVLGSTEEGRLLGALYFLRNQATHQLIAT